MPKVELQANICAQGLADALPVGVVIVNHCDQIVFVNRRFHEFKGSHQPVGLDTVLQSVHACDYERIAEAYRVAVHVAARTQREYRTANNVKGGRCH